MAVPHSIAVDHFTFAYDFGAPAALRDISLDVPAGACCAILGPTACGKTTLLHSIAGLLGTHHHRAVSSGSMHIGGRPFHPMPSDVLFPEVTLLLQEPHVQVSGMNETVEEEIRWTLGNMGIAGESADRRVRQVLEQLQITPLSAQSLRSLSGGELHRVALASVLVGEPSLLLLDEPVSSLDQLARQAVVDLLRSLKRTTTVVLTDTEPDLALFVSDWIVVLDAGCVRFAGTPAEFLRLLGALSDILPTGQWISALESLRALDPAHPLRQRLKSLVVGM